ncbi:MAG TPA: hypothetical protein PKX12_07735 [Spirochaetota bacterium]|nr:hypothetical protein [Spirochaetota bacterium]
MDIFLILLFLFILLIVAWALFGKGDGADAGESEADREAQLRRRVSDQEIEELYPSNDPAHPRRRKADRSQSSETLEEEDVDDDFKLPYSVDEIISDTSQFRIYKRTLVNSEIYAKKGDFETAISLYDGVNERINDINTNRKIDANIQYLRNFREFKEKEKKEEESLANKMKHRKGNEIRLSIDGPLTIPDKIQIGLTAPIQKDEQQQKIDIDKIVEEITKKILDSRIFDSQQEQDSRKYINEIEDIKDGLKQLIDSNKKQDALSVEDIAKKNRELEEKIDELSRIKDELQRLEDLSRQRDESITSEELSKFKEKLEKIDNKVSRLEEIGKEPHPRYEPIPEADRKPTIIEARYESPIPVTLDPKPILELLKNLPRQQTPEPKVLDVPETPGPAVPRDARQEKPSPPEKISKEQEDIDQNILKREKEAEPEEEWELLSRYGKDNDDGSLTDEDIYAKILEDDSRDKIQDSIEILGEDKKSSDEGPLGISNAEYDKKQKEEEEFYEKFLKHERRIRKELPILKVTYDFSRLPDEFSLSRDKNILEYSFYRYKPILEKANGFIKTRHVRDALNYYKTVMQQNIPPEFKVMIRKNINDLTEYLEKYLSTD